MNTTTRLLLAFLLLIVAACGKKEEPEPRSSSQPDTSSKAAGNDWTNRVKVKTGDVRLLEIKWNDRKVKVEVGPDLSPTVFKGEMRDGGKRKYSIEGGAPVVEVKSDSNGFKVRTAEGKLLWKVKITDEKIKISDNEENANPYEIKLKGDDVRAEENDAKLGEVKFYPDRDKVKVKNAQDVEVADANTSIRSVAYALVLMPRIPPSERAIIMAELMVRGK